VSRYGGAVQGGVERVTLALGPAFESPVRLGVSVLAGLLALTACGGETAATTSPTPSGVASPTPTPSLPPSPSPTPSSLPSPIPVPSWAAMHATCSGATSAREAVLIIKGSVTKIIADVTDPLHPKTICTLTGGWQPQLVTANEISWSASERAPGTPGPSMIATLDVFSGTTAVVATWTGGGFLDGMHAWSPGRELLAYLTSDTSSVDLHLLSGGGDRVVASLGAVPARGANPSEDDAYLDFAPDGAYFALEQTVTGSGAQLQVRKATDGTLAYSQPKATMATWGSTGSKLYFRHPAAAVIYAWDPVAGLTQPLTQQLAWIKPRADAGDQYLAFTVRDAAGTPHVWLNAHAAKTGTQLASVRSSPVFLTATTVFDIEEASCGVNCGPGPATQPTGRSFTYDITHKVESASTILSVLATWPRPGQV
jgi:hypothetical protein